LLTYIKKAVSLLSALFLVVGLLASIPVLLAEGTEDQYDAEAIQLLKSLSIMNGHEDGRLDLAGTLTRAQAAKMIYTARTGANDNAKLFDRPGEETFSDVPHGYWAAGYINYCAVQGYVSGRGNNRFDPEGKITGFEFMKILLSALGYDAAEERFINNSGWQLFTVTAAVEAGLTEGYSGNPGSFITRGEAARLTANMIFAKTVSYNVKKQRVTSDIDFGEKYLKLKVNTGIVTANVVTNASLAGMTSIAVPENGTGTSGIYSADTGLDEIGQTVTIYTKGNSFTDIYGAVNVSPKNKVFTTYSRLSDADAAQVGSFSGWLAANGLEIGGSAPVYITKGIGPESSEPITSNAAGERLRVIDNDADGKVDYILKLVKTAATVLSISEEDGSVDFDTIDGAWNTKSIEGMSGISEGDIVLAYEYGGKLRLNMAGSVSGKMTESVPMLGKATISNIEYSESGLAFADIDGGETGAVSFVQWISDSSNFMKERLFYLDDGGNIILIRTPESELPVRRYAMVIDSGCSYDDVPYIPQSAAVQLLYTDGSTAVAKVNKIEGSLVRYIPREELKRLFDPETADESLIKGKIFSYTVNSDGSIDLQQAQNQTTAPSSITRNDPNLIPGSIYADSKTAFISFNSVLWRSNTYNGIQNVPSYSSVTGAVVFEGKVAKAVFITSSVTAPVNPAYTYVTGSPTAMLTQDGSNVYSYPVFENGEPGTLVVDESNGDIEAGLYTYTVSEWGVYDFKPAGDIRGTISLTGDGIIAVGTTAYITGDSTQVNKIKADGTLVRASLSALREGNEVMIVLAAGESSSTADMIFILSGR